LGNKRKLLVVGLDSAPPRLFFDELRSRIPNISKLMDEGVYGEMQSCDPPITIPAWMVMMTGKNPGKLGIYGFRHRKGPSYSEGWIANSASVKEPKMWDLLGKHGKQVCLVGVPPGFPPTPVNGYQVSCFITPGPEKDYTYPSSLKAEIESLVGNYLFDVVFRTDDRDTLLKQLYEMTEKRFQVIAHMIQTKPWDLFMFVEIGVDRLHHAFWKFYDKDHPRFEPGNRYEKVIPEYYEFIDKKIGELLGMIDEDTSVLVVSDHGTKGMRGAFCINQWLIQEGYLHLKEKPRNIVDLDKAGVDWSKTKAWGWGGYYARIFLNMKGREKDGIIDNSDYEKIRTELALKLQKIRDPSGRLMATKVFRPEELYGKFVGDAPDLMVYFDDLFWRSAGTLGHDSLYLSENDTGPDDSVHAFEGIFILRTPGKRVGKNIGKISIYEIAPTLLKLMGENPIDGMDGKPRVDIVP